MPGWQRTYVAVCSAIIGYALAYVLCDYGGWSRLVYFPYERSLRWMAGPTGSIPMPYVGMILWGLGGALAAGALALIGCRVLGRPLTDRWLRLFGAWALAAFAYAGLYHTWNLWPF